MANVVEKSTAQQADEILDDEALAEEKLLEELENEELPSHIRDARMSELKEQVHQYQQHKEKGYGLYSTIDKEKSVLDITTQETRVVIHFFHPDFRSCALVDKHLETLAEKHFGTKFARVSVDIAKFLVTKLKIQVLPAILSFRDGIVVDRLIGFEELGNNDNFTTEELEKRLAKTGIILLPDVRPESNKSLFGYAKRRDEDDDSSEPEDL
ncbi:uncharacterized protein [Amphiura filiformis]|uniref:uncharacterized protein n=1 Tax=Amphiura filiformis TaxID=82378 RepID=UPI003B20CB61